MHPLTTALILKNPAFSQLSKMPGYLGLADLKSSHQFADTEFTFFRNQQNTVKTGVIGKAFE